MPKLDAEARRRLMARFQSTDTRAELALRNALRRSRLTGYRIHLRTLPVAQTSRTRDGGWRSSSMACFGTAIQMHLCLAQKVTTGMRRSGGTRIAIER